MAGFVGVAVASLAILWPGDWELTADPQSVIQTYSDSDPVVSMDKLRCGISLYMDRSYVDNKKGLERLAILFQIASVLLTMEVVLWIVAIASTR